MSASADRRPWYRSSVGRFCLAIALFPLLGSAQTGTGALLRGVLLERDAHQFSVRAADDQVFRFSFDNKTYVESEGQMIDMARLAPGEKVEVLSDKLPAAAIRYALTIHVLPSSAPPRRVAAARMRAYTALEEGIPPGALSFSGVVARVSSEKLVLRTRDKGDQTILLRPGTRYAANGEAAGEADLKPNMMIYVRAGKTLYDEIEAYQVVWGRILRP